MHSKFFDSIKSKHILVAGEIGIDEYVMGDSVRVSPEAPVPVVEVSERILKLAMAANVAQNIQSLGGKSTLISVIGDDSDRETLNEMLDESGLSTGNITVDKSRPTLRKTRIIARKQHVVRVDYEKSHELTQEIARKFRKSIEEHLDEADGIIVQDYGKGLWTEEVMKFVPLARKKNCPVYVDPCRQHPPKLYRNTTLLSPNIDEAQTMVGGAARFGRVHGDDLERLRSLANALISETESEHMVITCGADGMVCLSREDGTFRHIPTFAREVFDVTGAGDTVISLLALTHSLGLPISRCMQIANAAAGIVVGRIGAGCVTPEELANEFQRLDSVGMVSDNPFRIQETIGLTH